MWHWKNHAKYTKYQTYPVFINAKKRAWNKAVHSSKHLFNEKLFGILNQGVKNAYKDKLNDESQTFTSSTYVFWSKLWIPSPQLLVSQFWMVDCIGDWQDQRNARYKGSINVIPFSPIKCVCTNFVKKLEFYKWPTCIKHSTKRVVLDVVYSIVVARREPHAWYGMENCVMELQDHGFPEFWNTALGQHLTTR